jgi:hypothetical protein
MSPITKTMLTGLEKLPGGVAKFHRVAASLNARWRREKGLKPQEPARTSYKRGEVRSDAGGADPAVPPPPTQGGASAHVEETRRHP